MLWVAGAVKEGDEERERSKKDGGDDDDGRGDQQRSE
jgi:hypothetical protein